ncbi:multifunctional aminopeptidase A [Bibersteinia trehalosi Y31]|uniref:Probable cytosol aminopeptidase n=1 Tax=Bibersteinia trehalosi Y31 TaxID=1261658 RepID=A0A179CX77_BIBTR|nr:leucyl aminopeptidase [Bibersteinia trehalosi]OAQ14509.1 multifunctional aminopeptidase A [Bibersteinia trehalosi Y31]
MQFNLIPTNEWQNQVTDCLVVAVFEEGKLSSSAQQVDQASHGFLSQLQAQGDLSGKVAQGLVLHHVPNIQAKRVLAIGCGKQGETTERQFKQLVQKCVELLGQTQVQRAVFALAEVEIKQRSPYWSVRFAVEAICESLYRFEQFKTTKSAESSLAQISFVAEGNDAETALVHAQAVAIGAKFTKDVANCPPNVCNPRYLADCALALAEQYSTINTTIVDEKQMAELGMNSYLAVSRGSANEAFMSIINYQNNGNAKPIVLIGKGMTFDSGGISLKPGEAMDEMKYDMGGAAAVYGTMKAIAELNLPLNVIGVLAGCENMPDANAYRPGDIITTMSGKTVEVLNTDAEGRMVLCDALTYAERFEPELVIDVATLTGACMIALGNHNSGLISTDDELAEQLFQAGQASGDKVWRLPMGEEYQEQLKSNFADLAHLGGRMGGAITAGVFLSNFADKFRWAHLDIAGTAWKSGAAKGATGRPVPLLTEFLINHAK